MTVSAASKAGGVVAADRGRPEFAQFYAQQWSDVAGFSAALVGSVNLGDDVAQEAFARLYARYPLVRDPRPYVFRVAANLAKRQNARRAESLLDDLPEIVAPAVGVDPGLLDAVRRLPPRLSVVVLLHYYADLSVDEVARTLRRPAGSVKRQLSEARTVLAHTLGEQP
jgi:RNA polymerase sigma-70 factor (ECF subfamily)